jgi:hypothetical protein
VAADAVGDVGGAGLFRQRFGVDSWSNMTSGSALIAAAAALNEVVA